MHINTCFWLCSKLRLHMLLVQSAVASQAVFGALLTGPRCGADVNFDAPEAIDVAALRRCMLDLRVRLT